MKSKIIKQILKWGFIISLFGILSFFGFYYGVSFGFWGKMPSDEDLLNIRNYEASEIYTSDSVLIGKIYLENRSNVKLEDVPPNLITQLIATEDSRFYDHDGFDKTGALRVLIRSIILQQDAGGGSTISQQLAKNIFGRKDFGILSMPVNKAKEVIIAKQLEELYTKDEILTLYLNTVSFGEDTYGIASASLRFFNKKPSELEPEESAVLVGMLKSPTLFNPRLHPVRALNRRNTVLAQWSKYNYVQEVEYKKLKALPIELDYTSMSLTNGVAPHFRTIIHRKLKDVLGSEEEDFQTLKTSGLKIYTTIHYELQKNAEQAVKENLTRLQPQFIANTSKNVEIQTYLNRLLENSSRYRLLQEKGFSKVEILEKLRLKKKRALPSNFGVKDSMISFIDSLKFVNQQLHTGFYAIDPNTGYILAWVGSEDYQSYQYDYVTSKRQVGSVFKPFVYAAGLENAYKPCTFIDNQKVTYEAYDGWTPKNADGNYSGKYSLVGGLTNSVNTISVRLLMDLGINRTLRFIHKLGIKDSLPKVPSVALGVGNHSLFDMVNVYTAFSNAGNRMEPIFITSIKNQQGDFLFQSEIKSENVIKEQTANDISEMLESVVEHGTANRLRSHYGISGKISGKTGTTQNHSDGWFIGYKENFVAGVWVGANNPAVHFDNIGQGQGANLALPVWAKFYRLSQASINTKQFVEAELEIDRSIDCGLFKDDNLLQKIFKGDNGVYRRKGLNENKFKKGIRKFFNRKE
jgi:penicillin-binding protein 1A